MSKKLFVTCFLLACALGSIPLVKAFAQGTTLSDQQITLIKDNCVSSRNTLNQLHVSDALLRVNMGQVYESMSTKLMDKFNSRISYNSLSNSDLVAVSKDYVSTLDEFRLDYIAYEAQLSLALKIDCEKKPADFYDAISVAYKGRNQVHDDVLKLNQYIDKYQLALDKFEKDYQAIGEGSKK